MEAHFYSALDHLNKAVEALRSLDKDAANRVARSVHVVAQQIIETIADLTAQSQSSLHDYEIFGEDRTVSIGAHQTSTNLNAAVTRSTLGGHSSSRLGRALTGSYLSSQQNINKETDDSSSIPGILPMSSISSSGLRSFGASRLNRPYNLVTAQNVSSEDIGVQSPSQRPLQTPPLTPSPAFWSGNATQFKATGGAVVINKKFAETRLKTWAAVAASGAEHLKPGSGFKHDYTSTQALGPSASTSLADQELRVVFIMHLPKHGVKLEKITGFITQGPLYAIDLVHVSEQNDLGALIIFKEAEHAKEFRATVDIGAMSRAIGSSVELVEGGPWPTSDSIRAMDPPLNARRRLTIAASRLFTRVRQSIFEKDIRGWVGEQNVEKIFLYNTGNATVILASVEQAAIVKERIEHLSKRGGRYEGVNVSFSRDSTEQPLRLVSSCPSEKELFGYSQMHHGR